MAETKVKQQILSLELTKLIAACFVVCIHAPFPGKLGDIVMCLGRFAVPFFFAVSGYFSLRIDRTRIRKRMTHILKLHLITAVLCVAMGCILRIGNIQDLLYYLRWETLPDTNEWIRLLILQENPYGGHLWYLSSLLLCYGVLWGYETFWEGESGKTGPLYRAAFTLFATFCAMSMLVRMEGMQVPFKAYRNGWLMGIPMFTMGMFLHEYQERIMNNFCLTDRKMALLMALGVVLTVMQQLSGGAGELPFGMLLLVPVLLLFLMKHPQLPVKNNWAQKLVSRFGVLSTAVYLLHIAALDLYNLFLKERALALFGTKEDMLMPLVVLAMTFVGAFLWERIDWILIGKKCHG